MADDEELDIEVTPEELEYKFLPDGDAQLRAFVFEYMANPEYQPGPMIEAMDRMVVWIREGSQTTLGKLRAV